MRGDGSQEPPSSPLPGPSPDGSGSPDHVVSPAIGSSIGFPSQEPDVKKKWESGLQVVDEHIGGSNGAKKVQDADGKHWALKSYHMRNSEADASNQAKTEFLANSILHTLGVKVPETRLVDNELGGQSVATAWIPNAKSVNPQPSNHEDLRNGYAADIWLANYDSAGMAGDNLLEDQAGGIHRIDNGGSLMFRAMGGRKNPKLWGADSAVDVYSMMNPTINMTAAPDIFQDISDDDISKGIDNIQNVMTTENIESLVKRCQFDPETERDCRNVLMERRDKMVKMNDNYKSGKGFVASKLSLASRIIVALGQPGKPSFHYKSNEKPWTEAEWKAYKQQHPQTELHPPIQHYEKYTNTDTGKDMYRTKHGDFHKDVFETKDHPKAKTLKAMDAVHSKHQSNFPVNSKGGNPVGGSSDSVVPPASPAIPPSPAKTEPAPQPQPSPSQSGSDEWQKGLKKVGKIGKGHSGAEKWTDADGKNWVVKKYQGDSMGKDHARVERLASNLLNALGVPAPESRVVNVDGQPAIANAWVDHDNEVTESVGGDHPDVRKGYAADIWLANYDSIGGVEGYNSVVGKDGHAYRIDNGGALCFKGTAGMKPSEAWAAPGKEGSEELYVHSLKDPDKQTVAPKVFKHVTDEDISKGIDDIEKTMDDSTIKKHVDEAGLSPAVADNVYKGLVRRRDSMVKMNQQYKKTGQFPGKQASGGSYFSILLEFDPIVISSVHRAVLEGGAVSDFCRHAMAGFDGEAFLSEQHRAECQRQCGLLNDSSVSRILSRNKSA
jgi:hypothetical protein